MPCFAPLSSWRWRSNGLRGRKLNEHKSDEDHVSVARHLFATGERGALAIAEKMRALRPHLDYSADREAEMPVSLASIRPGRTPTACG
jgi:hypothetical protein